MSENTLYTMHYEDQIPEKFHMLSNIFFHSIENKIYQ